MSASKLYPPPQAPTPSRPSRSASTPSPSSCRDSRSSYPPATASASARRRPSTASCRPVPSKNPSRCAPRARSYRPTRRAILAPRSISGPSRVCQLSVAAGGTRSISCSRSRASCPVRTPAAASTSTARAIAPGISRSTASIRTSRAQADRTSRPCGRIPMRWPSSRSSPGTRRPNSGVTAAARSR